MTLKATGKRIVVGGGGDDRLILRWEDREVGFATLSCDEAEALAERLVRAAGVVREQTAEMAARREVRAAGEGG